MPTVQNGQRPVTKQDLADFYQAVLPYMGGMPEMVANKFSKGDLYSTDEKMIGQWTDGKPLYQKVVTATLGASSTTIDVSSLDIETFCFSKGMINNGSSMIPIPYVNDTMYYMAVNYYSITNDTITIVNKNMENATVHIAIQYTKTTDTAISIGEDTDYSTDEKIVGTWIDGKPIYQKTIQVRPTKNYPDSGYVTDTIYTDSNVDYMILMTGTIQFTYGNYTQRPLPYTLRTDSSHQYSAVPKWDSGNLIMEMYVEGSSYAPSDILFTITLQYTKAN